MNSKVQEHINIEHPITDKSRGKHHLIINMKRILVDGEHYLISCRDITQMKMAQLLAEENLEEILQYMRRKRAEDDRAQEKD